MLQRVGPRLRYVLSMATLITLLGVTAGLWWWLPVWPRAVWSGVLTWDVAAWFPQNVIISPNGRTLAAQESNNLHLWDVATGEKIGCIPRDWAGDFTANWFLPDGRTVVIPTLPKHGKDKSLRFHSIVAVSPDGKLLVVYYDNTPVAANKEYQSEVIVWDVTTGAERPGAPWDASRLAEVVQRADGAVLEIERHTFNSFTVWELLGAKRGASFEGVGSAGFQAGGRLIAIITDTEVQLCDPMTGQRHYEIRVPGGPSCIRWDEAAHRACLLDVEDCLSVWDTSAATPEKIGQFTTGPFLEFSPDGRWLAVSKSALGSGPGSIPSDIGGITVWDLAAVQEKCVISDYFRGEYPNLLHPNPKFAPDSQTIAAVVAPATSWLDLIFTRRADSLGVRIWDASTGRVLGTLPNSIGFRYFPGSKRLATWCEDGTIRIWDLPPRRPWYIEYGLPVLFALLVLLGVRLVWRAVRKSAKSAASEGQVPD